MMVTYFKETNIRTIWIDLYVNIVHHDFVAEKYFPGDEIKDK